MNKTILLLLGALLVLVGLVGPNLPINKPKPIVDNTIVIVTPPADKDLREVCQSVIDALKSGSSDRRVDGRRLSELYSDLATLIELDGENEVIKTTEEIRQANSLSGVMLRMDLRGKYPKLAEAAQSALSKTIGDDMILLDKELRAKAAETFRALSWATNEGSK